MAQHSRYGTRRSQATRSVLAVITVVCDDTRTSVAYFDLLKQEVKERLTVQVKRAPRPGADGKAVLALAVSTRPVESEATDQTFALLDLDTVPDHVSLNATAQAAGVGIAYSQPCYEIWTLAHLADTGEHFADCDTVVKRVAAEWKRTFNQEFSGKKAQADYAKIMVYRDDAIQRCRRRSLSPSPSWTDVWWVVDAIIKPTE